MYERNHQRFPSEAKARLSGVIKKDAHIKDFSVTGCCLESSALENIKLNETYSIEIIPEKISRVKKFTITAEARWIRQVEESFYAGFFIAVSPTGELFQHFVDYLSWRPSSNKASSE